MKFIIFPRKSELKIPNSLTKFPFIHYQHNNEKLETKKNTAVVILLNFSAPCYFFIWHINLALKPFVTSVKTQTWQAGVSQKRKLAEDNRESKIIRKEPEDETRKKIKNRPWHIPSILPRNLSHWLEGLAADAAPWPARLKLMDDNGYQLTATLDWGVRRGRSKQGLLIPGDLVNEGRRKRLVSEILRQKFCCNN